MTFSDLKTRYESTILCLKKPASIATISGHFRGLNEVFGSLELDQLDYPTVQSFFSEFSKTRSPKTVHNVWSSLRLVLNQAKREGLILSVPEIQLPKVRRVEQSWFSEAELRKLAAYDPLFALLAETGLRIGEALGLRFGDIDFKAKTLTVKRSLYLGVEQDPKTDSSMRKLCISSRLRDLLAAPGSENSQIFPVSAMTALNRLHRVLKHLKIKQSGFHSFRRGNITLLANKLGMPEAILARRVGHVLQSMTLGVYCQTEELADRPWAERIGKLLLPSPPSV